MGGHLLKYLLLLLVAVACNQEEPRASGPYDFYDYQSLNYDFKRYENSEAICYMNGSALSCIKK